MAIAIALWVVALLVGLHIQWKYAATPAPEAVSIPEVWPNASRLLREPGKQTLVLFAHPRCPCTRATLEELKELMGSRGNPLARTELVVDFVQPRGATAAFLQGENWARAEALPSARVIADENGAEAGRFSATTSGQLALYSATGALLFSGGITALRGHAGDNTGLHRMEEALAGRTPDARTYPVFGCALGGDAARAAR